MGPPEIESTPLHIKGKDRLDEHQATEIRKDEVNVDRQELKTEEPPQKLEQPPPVKVKESPETPAEETPNQQHQESIKSKETTTVKEDLQVSLKETKKDDQPPPLVVETPPEEPPSVVTNHREPEDLHVSKASKEVSSALDKSSVDSSVHSAHLADSSVGLEVNVETADDMSRRYTSSSARAG